MPINKEKLKNHAGSRFYIYGTDEKSEYPEWIEIRLLSGSDLEEVDKATSKTVTEFLQPRKQGGKIDKRAALQPVERTVWLDEENSPILAKQMRIERSIVDWQVWEITDDDKYIPFPYTPENVVFLIDKDPDFAKGWTEAIEILLETKTAKAVGEKKTSLTSPKRSKRKSNAETV